MNPRRAKHQLGLVPGFFAAAGTRPERAAAFRGENDCLAVPSRAEVPEQVVAGVTACASVHPIDAAQAA